MAILIADDDPVARRLLEAMVQKFGYEAVTVEGGDAAAALPAEFSHEPRLALAGGPDGMDIVRRILAEAGAHLRRGGGLLCEIGRGRGILERDYPEQDFLWLDTARSSGEVFWITATALRK